MTCATQKHTANDAELPPSERARRAMTALVAGLGFCTVSWDSPAAILAELRPRLDCVTLSLNPIMPHLCATLGNGYTVVLALGVQFDVAATWPSFCIFVIPGTVRLIDSPYIACLPTMGPFGYHLLYPPDGTQFLAWTLENVNVSATVEGAAIRFHDHRRAVTLSRVCSHTIRDGSIETIFFEVDSINGLLGQEMANYVAFGYGASEAESIANAAKNTARFLLFNDDIICNESGEM